MSLLPMKDGGLCNVWFARPRERVDLFRECSLDKIGLKPCAMRSDQGDDHSAVVVDIKANDMVLGMHRHPLSAFDTSGLPTHLLRFLSKGMVLLAGISSYTLDQEPIHLSIMSSFRARDEAKCHCHYIARHVSTGESGKGQVGAGEERR